MTEQEISEMQARLASLETEKAALQAAADSYKAEQQKLADEKAGLQEENKKLSEQLKVEKEKDAPLSFEIDEDNEDLDVKKGDTFEWTAPSLTWEDNGVYEVINVRELAASDDKKDQEKYALICASLVQRKSGLIRKKGE